MAKQTSKKSKNQKQTVINKPMPSESDEFKRLILLIIIVAVIALVFYFIAVVVSNKQKQLKYKEVTTKAQIEYDQLLASDIFRQTGDYYVLILKKDNEFSSLFNSYITTYKKKDGHLMVYKVDLGTVFNRDYLGEEANFDATNFHVNDDTLLRIQNGTVIESYVGNDKITEKLYQLGKTEKS